MLVVCWYPSGRASSWITSLKSAETGMHACMHYVMLEPKPNHATNMLLDPEFEPCLLWSLCTWVL